jgi:hypothetical protein
VFRALVGKGRSLVQGRWALVLALGVAGLGLVELGLQFRFATVAPRLSEWKAVRSAVEGFAEPGVLVVVAPAWAEPNARFALGDVWMPLEHVARPDESGFELALEIAILGQRAPELAGWELESEREAGKFSLRRYRNRNVVPVRYDFLAHVEPPDSSVAVERDGVGAPCPFSSNNKVTNGDLQGHPTFPKRRFVCSGGEWAFVGRTVIEDQNYRPRACMWAHPPSRGALVLRFGAVPIGASIRGYGGMPYIFERETHGTPVDVTVSVGGEPVGSYRHVDGEGWKGFEIPTPRFAGQVLPVEFRVTSRKAWRRDFCLQASIR